MNKEVALVSTEINEDVMATSITQQYEDINESAGTLFKKVINFGCALAQAKIKLDRRGLLKNRKQGQGMQGWLAEKCPNINYKTAMRWMGIAVKAANSLGCSSDQALRILSGEETDISGKVAKRRDMILAADSQRKLLQQLFNFASEDSGSVGRPTGTVATNTPRLSAVESAIRLWASPMAAFSSDREAFYKAAALLPLDKAKESHEELKLLLQALKKRISEGV